MMKNLIALSMLIPAICFSGCSDHDTTSLVITNNSRNSIDNVFIANQSQKWRIGSIYPKASIRFSEFLSGENNTSIHWISEGKAFSAKICYYAKNFPATGKIFINNGNVIYECGNKVD